MRVTEVALFPKISYHIQFKNVVSNGTSVASTSELYTAATLASLMVRDKKV